ncbi:MAG: isoprenylcysteine carboxylmethyltransferase family protein [Gemmatimonadaceae bacterium]|nr:isoprenylcysteine carboxylmethyltransferase family protein [Gemmatimonadaceae bacterium]
MSDTETHPASVASPMSRAILAFMALPGLVAYAIPLVIARVTKPAGHFAFAGLLEIVLGSVVLLWCTREFHVSGHGTLAPWSPPMALARGGLYRWSRNPMYIGVLLIVIGWALGFNSGALWAYAGVLLVAFHLRVVFGEEPHLARAFGDEWKAYRKRVPRWIL